MSCSGFNIFGDDTCESGGGLTPGQEAELDSVVEKTQNQDATAGNTNFSGVLTLNGLPLGSGGGDVVGPATSADNGVCFYSGATGKIIKEVATIKYNPIPNNLAVPDLSTTVTTSLNLELGKISNIISAVQLPNPITVLDGELDVKVIKSFEKNVELEFDDDNAILTATTVTLNSDTVASSGDIKVYDPTGADPDNSLLTKDRISFRGNPAFTSNGVVRYLEGGLSRAIEMTIDSGNFPQASTARIIVDGRTYTFTQDFLDMDTKRIVGLGEPIGPLDATTKNYVDQAFIDPVINSSITLENQTTPNTLLLASFATGENRIDSSGNLEINGSNLTMNLTGGNLTENVGNNKISIVSGNLTENISANKVTTITAAHISTALSHTFNGALTSSTSVTTPTITATQIYPTITGLPFPHRDSLKLNGDVIGGVIDTYIQMNSTDINIIANSNITINTSDSIILQGEVSLNNTIETTKTIFTADQELVTKKYVDDNSTGSPYELIFAVTDQVSLITTTGQKFQIRAPRAFTLSKIKLSLNSTAGPSFIVTILKNGGTVATITASALVQDASNTTAFLEDDIISVDISNIGAGTASGLIVYLLE